jgi:predicted Zn-dependent protease
MLLLALFLGSGCATRDPVTGKRSYNVYTLQDDIRLGQATVQANTDQLITQGIRVNQDRARLRQLNDMVERIAAVSDLPDLPYTVTLYHTNLVNAAAAPGGSLMVFEGLYDPREGLVKDDDELAAVLAHEIAHVTCRHVTERLSKGKTTEIITGTLGTVADVMGYGDIYNVAHNVFSLSSVIWIPAYSRQDEAEADRVGMRYLANAGYDPRAAVRIWTRASKDAGNQPAESIFSSHPSNRNREAALRALVPRAMEDYRRVTGSYPPGYRP